MLWEPLATQLTLSQVKSLQALLAFFKEQNIEGSALVIAEDLEWLSPEDCQSIFQKLTPSQQEEEWFQAERFLGHIGMSNGFLGEDEVEEVLQFLKENPQKTSLWECLEQKSIVESSDLQAVVKARKALCKQSLKMAEVEDSLGTTAPATPEVFEDDEEDEDLSDLDMYEDIEATLSEMSFSFVTEEEDDILDLQVEEAHFFEGSKYKRFKEWRQSQYSKALLKKLEA